MRLRRHHEQGHLLAGRNRWPPLLAGEGWTIDIARRRVTCDQLFAEAVGFQDGDAWWPDKDFEREHIVPEQAERVTKPMLGRIPFANF